MGQLSRWELDYLKHSGFSNYVETGTGLGVSLCHAISDPRINQLYSIDSDKTLLERSSLRDSIAMRKRSEQNVTLLHSNSVIGLFEVLKKLDNSPTLFFLDAHFPLADFFGLDYKDSIVKFGAFALPLISELALIANFRKELRGDVLVIDDLILYERGQFEFDISHPKESRSIREVLRQLDVWLGDGFEPCLKQIFGSGIALERDYKHQGYLIIRFPN
jgi:hypothetical protein